MATENVNTSLLLNQLRQGDERAFAKVYDYFSKPVYRKILRLVNDEDIAQELLQEVFLTVWIKRDKIEPNGTFWAYLYQIAKWLIYNHYRKIAQNKKLLDHLITTSVDHVLNGEQMLIDKETHHLLNKAIETLPPQRKLVFKLCKIEGKSYQEVAELLGISTATIRNQIVAANKSVKEYFLLHQDVAIVLISLTITYLISGSNLHML